MFKKILRTSIIISCLSCCVAVNVQAADDYWSQGANQSRAQQKNPHVDPALLDKKKYSPTKKESNDLQKMYEEIGKTGEIKPPQKKK
jgi:hypothetical protein